MVVPLAALGLIDEGSKLSTRWPKVSWLTADASTPESGSTIILVPVEDVT